MKNLMKKELTLAANPLTYVFLAEVLLTFVPGYPILLGPFFLTLGLFYSFQTMRENHDIEYSLLLPVAKADVVRSKFCFVLLIEGVGFILTAIGTLIRMTLLRDAPLYTGNALMCANLNFLGFALLIYGLFNFVFVRGFFKTAYAFGKPFLLYGIFLFFTIAIAETLPHLPGCRALNAFGFTPFLPQAMVLAAGAVSFAVLTLLSVASSVRRFEKLDF